MSGAFLGTAFSPHAFATPVVGAPRDFIPISTEDELLNIQVNPTGNYYLVNDIALTKPWYGRNFSGVLNGCGYEVTGLDARPLTPTSPSGLISVLDYGGEVHNLGVRGTATYPATSGYTALLVGTCYGKVIRNCYAVGEVTARPTGSGQAGGLVGYVSEFSLVQCCYAQVNVSAGGANTGGFLGYHDGTTTNAGVGAPACYYPNTENSGVTSNPAPVALADMTVQASYAGFDFDYTWFPPTGGQPPTLRKPGRVRVKTAAELLAAFTNNFGAWVYLDNDITLGAWTPPASFYGTLDGCGHVIDFGTVNAGNTGHFGLVDIFRGRVSRVTFRGAVTHGAAYYTGYASARLGVGSLVHDVHTEGSIVSTDRVGAVVGYADNYSAVVNCIVGTTGYTPGQARTGVLIGFANALARWLRNATRASVITSTVAAGSNSTANSGLPNPVARYDASLASDKGLAAAIARRGWKRAVGPIPEEALTALAAALDVPVSNLVIDTAWGALTGQTSNHSYSAANNFLGRPVAAFNGTSTTVLFQTRAETTPTPVNGLVVELWLYPANVSRTERVATLASSDTARVWSLKLVNGVPRFELWPAGSGAALATLDLPALTVSTWAHLRFTVWDGVVYGFVGGVLVGSTPFTGTINPATSYPVRLGRHYSSASEWFTGRMADVVIRFGVPATSNYTPPATRYLDGITPPYPARADFVIPGFNAGKFGVTQVVYASGGQLVYPSGIPRSNAFGTAKTQRTVKTYGWLSEQMGPPTLANFDQTVYVFPFTGQPPVPSSGAHVLNALQYLRPPGRAPAQAFGTVVVSNQYRDVYPAPLVNVTQFGAGWVGFAVRNVYPVGVYRASPFGAAFVNFREREVRPIGVEATTWGTHEVKDSTQYVRPAGRASTLSGGVPLVRDRATRLYPFAWDSQLHGVGKVELFRRELRLSGWENYFPDSARFGPYPDVQNRRKRILADGFNALRMPPGAHQVLNTGRVIYPHPFFSDRYGPAFVAPRVRYVHPDTFGGELFGGTYTWTRKVVSLDGWGWRSAKFGIPSRVRSNLQTLQPYSTDPMTQMGTAHWVAPGTREVRPFPILTVPLGDPAVAYRVRYVRPASIDPGYFGTAILETKQYIIRAWGDAFGGVGVPDVRNVTPEIRVFGALAYLPGGKPRVELMKRYVRPTSVDDAPPPPRPFVAYRTRTVRLSAGPDFLRWGLTEVKFDASQYAPPQQYVLPGGFSTYGVGEVEVRLNSVYPGGIPPGGFGTPTMRSMAIVVDRAVESIIVMGRPTLLGGTQWLRPAGFGQLSVVGGPAVVGPQVVDTGRMWSAGPPPVWSDAFPPYHSFGNRDDNNNADTPENTWVPLDSGPVFGARTRVALKHRKVFPFGAVPAGVGAPRISTRPQYVRPDGIRGYRAGIHEVFYPGTNVLDVAYQGIPSMVFGAARVVLQDYGPKWLSGVTLGDQGGEGKPVVMNFHRYLPVAGWDSFTSPRGAQYVGPYQWVYPIGSETTLWGEAYIDYRHRSVKQLNNQNDTPPWALSRATIVKHEPRGYYVEGSDFGVQFGNPDVGHRVKSISPVGWEEFQTGFSFLPQDYPGLSKLKAQAFIAPPYTANTEFGNGTTIEHG